MKKGALQPLPAGDYRVKIYAYGALPAWCTEPPQDSVYACDSSAGPGAATVWHPYGLCDPTQDDDVSLATAEFTLPAAGDLEVLLPML